MIETGKKYPAYRQDSIDIKQKRVMLALSYEQVLEIANISYFQNLHVANRFGSGMKLDDTQRSLHKAVHDAAVNCCMSIESSVLFDSKEAPAV